MAGDFSTGTQRSDVTDLLLLERLLSFSPFPAITKSGWLSNSFICLRRITNQNAPNDARRTTTIGTTIAGMRVVRFEEDF